MCLSVVTDVYRCSGISLLRLTCVYIYIYTSLNPANRITKGSVKRFFLKISLAISRTKTLSILYNIIIFSLPIFTRIFRRSCFPIHACDKKKKIKVVLYAQLVDPFSFDPYAGFALKSGRNEDIIFAQRSSGHDFPNYELFFK